MNLYSIYYVEYVTKVYIIFIFNEDINSITGLNIIFVNTYFDENTKK